MILLDTNALLWLLEDAQALGVSARERVLAGRVYFSPVSVTEVVIKVALGKLSVDDPREGALRAGLEELPYTAAHAAAMASFPGLPRHDPFDRMLLAQASVEDMPLLTSDRTLLSSAPTHTLDARA